MRLDEVAVTPALERACDLHVFKHAWPLVSSMQSLPMHCEKAKEFRVYEGTRADVKIRRRLDDARAFPRREQAHHRVRQLVKGEDALRRSPDYALFDESHALIPPATFKRSGSG
jgi:hypothetical protein